MARRAVEALTRSRRYYVSCVGQSCTNSHCQLGLLQFRLSCSARAGWLPNGKRLLPDTGLSAVERVPFVAAFDVDHQLTVVVTACAICTVSRTRFAYAVDLFIRQVENHTAHPARTFSCILYINS